MNRTEINARFDAIEAEIETLCATKESALANRQRISLLFTQHDDLIRIVPKAEDLTPEGIQLVIPGAERIQPANVKQGSLF
jgi:hypothetical protein